MSVGRTRRLKLALQVVRVWPRRVRQGGTTERGCCVWAANRGTETMIRFINKMYGKYYPLGSFPCTGKNGRPYGRPVSIHLHGSTTVPPYDGWADDMTCTYETKDYIYPNNKPSTMWYHDHALHETARNAYSGKYGRVVSAECRLCSAPISMGCTCSCIYRQWRYWAQAVERMTCILEWTASM
jgi:hypothetical protein